MNPKQYLHIKAWGNSLQSMAYYIEQQQQKAARMRAPLNAVYERDGTWITIDQCCDSIREDIEARVEKMKEAA